jgi:chitodextrinase
VQDDIIIWNICLNTPITEVAAPTFTVTGSDRKEENLYWEYADVSLASPTWQASLYYTTDGTTPTAESALYDGTPVRLTETARVKAIGIYGDLQSAVTDTLVSIAGGQTATLPYAETFNGNLGNWYACNVAGTQTWTAGEAGETTFATLSGLVGNDAFANEDWLISPAFTASGALAFSFSSARQFTGALLALRYSTDYTGVGDPSSATWTDVTASVALATANNLAWTESGEVVVMSASPVRFAFVYTSTADDAATWRVGNVAARNIACTYAVTAPEGASVYVGSKGGAHYVAFTEKLPVHTATADGKTTFYYNLSGKHNYRVSMPGKLTHTGVFTPSGAATGLEITLEQLNSHSPQEIDHNVNSNNFRNMADVFLNINERGHLKLASGNTYQLVNLRNWQAIDSDVNNYFIEPDYHYKVVNEQGVDNSSVVTVSDKGLLTAVGAGTAIVLVTYDAFNCASANTGPFFGALWPENTGVFVVSVDAAESGIVPNMHISDIWNNQGASQVAETSIDAEIDVFYYEQSTGGYDYTFTPSNVTSVELAQPALGANILSYSGFSGNGVTANGDGSYTVRLVFGRNIVKLSSATGSVYQVVSAKPVTCTVSNLTRSGAPYFQAGDSVSIVFNTLYHPCNKLAGIYNMSAGIQYTGFNADFPLILGPGQYTFASKAQTFKIKIPADYTDEDFKLVNGVLKINGYGSQYGAHRKIIPNEGALPNLNASVHAGYFGVLPDFYFRMVPNPSKPANLKATPTATTIALTWDPSVDDGAVVGYNIYIDNVLQTTVTETHHTLTGLLPSNGYKVDVEAVDNEGYKSTAKATVRPTTLDENAPDAPTALTVTAKTETSISLSWNAPEGEVPAATYNLYVNDEPVATALTATTHTLTGLTAATTYAIRVEAVSAAGKKSPQTDALVVTTNETPDVAPAAPTGLSTTVTETSIILTWNAPEGDIAGYTVYVNNEPIDAAITATTYTLTGLTAGTSYVIEVEAYSATGKTSERSNSVIATTAEETTTGVDDNEWTTLSLYPNPTADIATLSGLEGGEVITVFDISGRTRITLKATSPIERISVSNLPKGVYIVRIAKANAVKNIKLVVK